MYAAPLLAAKHGHADFDENLVLADRGRHQPLEPVVDLHGATALGALADHLGPERDHRRRIVRGGIGVGDRAADRPAVANGWIPDQRGDFGKDGELRFHQSGRLDIPVGGHGADCEHVAVLLDSREPGNLAQIDQVLGLGQPQLHHRDQAVAAREQLGVVLVLAEKLQRFLDGARRVIVERGWIHVALLVS